MRSIQTALLALLCTLFASIGCQQATPPPTPTNITVRYTLDHDIAAATHLNMQTGQLNEEDAVASLPGTISGDSTHDSYMTAHVFPAAEADPATAVLVQVPSPGHSSSDTVVLTRVSFEGPDLIVEYQKTSPTGESLADFCQFKSTVVVYKAG